MQFRYWIEAEEEKPHLGKMIKANKGVWMIPFNSIKKDPQEGWFADWFDEPGSIQDLADVSVDDKVSDQSLNFTPYWKVNGVDEQKGRIYLDPIEPNPFVTGVGAGGAKIDQFDMDVFSGDYERKRVDNILQDVKSGNVHSIGDVAYLLLGTVPMQMGPNGAQGGWYNATDTGSNRGGKQQIDARRIMMKDAETLKSQFGFAVPHKALSGQLDPHVWTNFVNGETDPKHAKETQVEGEDFNDPKSMLRSILEHPQPQIKKRNWEALVDRYRGYGRVQDERYALYRDEGISDKERSKKLEKIDAKWNRGDYEKKDVLPVLKNAVMGIAHLPSSSGNRLDPYWHLREKAIIFAAKEGWWDLVELFEKAKDAVNRRYVFDMYAGGIFHMDHPPKLDKMYRMLEDETNPEVLNSALYKLHKIGQNNNEVHKKTLDWINRHENVIEKAIQDPRDGQEVDLIVKRIKEWEGFRKHFKN
jgi:hypothetical protein